MSLITFPIIDAADQRFETSLNGRNAALRLRYNPTLDRWTFDLEIENEVVLYGRRLVTGVDLLAPFDLDVGLLFVTSGRVPEIMEPGRDQLISGVVRLYHCLEEDVHG